MDVFVPITANASPLHGMVNITIIGVFKKLNCYHYFKFRNFKHPHNPPVYEDDRGTKAAEGRKG